MTFCVTFSTNQLFTYDQSLEVKPEINGFVARSVSFFRIYCFQLGFVLLCFAYLLLPSSFIFVKNFRNDFEVM